MINEKAKSDEDHIISEPAF